MTWFFSPNVNGHELGLFSDNAQFPIQTAVTGVFFSRSAVPRIGSVVCFLGPLGEVGSLLE